jgi:hypothetical protein
MILDSEALLIQSSEVEESKMHVPESFVDFFETDVFFGKEVADLVSLGGDGIPRAA